MVNAPGASGILPSVISEVITQSRGVSIPGGIRTAALIGLGSRTETIIISALGSGLDGFNPTYTSTNGSDGRHFTLSLFPVVSNRTTLFKNGVPLILLEEDIDDGYFGSRYDARLDIETGRIELQRSALVDQAGSFYTSSATNVGNGTVENLSLVDNNAPTETWSIKCISVQRSAFNVPIANTAKFIAFGSVSGTKLDSNGNPVVWISNNQIVSNSVLQFSINEGSTVLREGDSFVIKVKGGVLSKNDTLTATYIAETDLNDPEFFSEIAAINKKHGSPTTENTLALGCDLAFSNSPPGIMTVQAKPAIPRRTSYNLFDTIDASSTDEDTFIIPLPFGVTPDFDAQIHFFVTNPTTGVETQVLPNKYEFYTLDTSGNPTTNDFIFDDTPAPGGYSFFYTVVKGTASINFAMDGYLNRSLTSSTLAQFSSDTVTFDSTYVGKQLKMVGSSENANNGIFDIISVSSGILGISATDSPPFATFVNETSVSFSLINPVTNTTVPLSTDNDGVLIAISSTSTATFTSSGIDFSDFATLLGLKLRVTVSANGNEGTFDITAYDSGTNTLTIAKSFVSEADLEFEVLDPDEESDFLVMNHNVMPDGNALRVTLVDSRDADFYDSQWTEALASLETVECDIVVALPTQTKSIIFQAALAHCRTMSNIRNRKERVFFTGAIQGLVPNNLIGSEAAAVEDIGILEGIQGDSVTEILSGNTEDLTNYSVSDAFGNTFRCVYFFPDEIVVQAGGDNVKVDGFYLAAAAAGFLSGISNVAIPLTNKVLTGFTILRNRQFTQTVLENLAAAGVCVLQPVAGGGRVLWGKTTTQSGFPEEEEISIVFIRDRIAKSMRAGFAGFIGTAEDPDTQSSMFARGTGLLNAFVSQRLITDYADLTVKRDAVDPRQWNVTVRVQPVYPVNWVYIKVSVGLL